MPAPSAFLKGFGIRKGMSIYGYVLEEVKIGHKVLQKYRHYQFPIRLIFSKGKASEDKFLDRLESLVGNEKVINSQYGNPYSCVFGTLRAKDLGDTIVVESLGDAVRV